MDVYNFINMFTDLGGIHVSIFDCTSEEVVFDWTEDDERDLFTALEEADMDGYEVEGVDFYKNRDDVMCLELNIEIEEVD